MKIFRARIFISLDPLTALTFQGNSEVRLNSTEPLKILFSFRTYSTDGKLLQLIDESENLTIHIIHGHLIVEYNKQIVLEFNDISISDGLWHDLNFFMDNSHSRLRLDQVFSGQIIRPQETPLNHDHHFQLIIGTDYHGCLGNLTLNNQPIPLSLSHDHSSLQFIATSIGCQLPTITNDNDDLCSRYSPCYHGGRCLNENEMSFTCNCSNPRFTGRQCQIDTYPCASHPCSYNEECLPISSNYHHQSFRCISLSPSINRLFYIGLFLALGLAALFIGFLCYVWKKPRKKFLRDAPFVSAPLLIQKSSTSTMKPIDGTMRTLLASDDRVLVRQSIM